jgi:hypothetical protein
MCINLDGIFSQLNKDESCYKQRKKIIRFLLLGFPKLKVLSDICSRNFLRQNKPQFDEEKM